MDWITDPDIWVALLTLTTLEIVLGIDNLVFLSILSGRLPANQQKRARTIGLSLAMGMRIALLLAINWVIGLTAPLFGVFGNEISGRDLILLLGGLFLIGKATFEIHEKLEGEEPEHARTTSAAASFGAVITQIVLIDAVFSLDSVITAVGMSDVLGVMIAAVVIAVGVMLLSSGPISDFVNRHPTVKMLALAFLLLIGTSLVAEGWELHIPKGYIYFAMGFSILVEALNLRARRVAAEPVELRPTYVKDPEARGAVGHLHHGPKEG
ncbi:MAG TPA: TerC family protein [Acidimicrobiia bacterium]